MEKMNFCFQAVVLLRHSAEYEVCTVCGYLRARNPYWLDEAYTSAIAAADTGLVMRNLSLASKVASFLFWVMGERGQGRYLDAAGGYGMLTRLMRDLGFDFYWADKYCDNLLARGFEYGEHLKGCRGVTAMEVMEHLADPVTFVDEALKTAGTDMLLFTTELYEGDPPGHDWWYYAFSSGQHIGFFTRMSLKTLGRRLGLNFISANGLHVLSRQAISQTRLQWATHPWFTKIAPVLIRRRLGSKTMADHQRMMSAL
jgi:hypothetical protein